MKAGVAVSISVQIPESRLPRNNIFVKDQNQDTSQEHPGTRLIRDENYQLCSKGICKLFRHWIVQGMATTGKTPIYLLIASCVEGGDNLT
jgi:hypothetical protein